MRPRMFARKNKAAERLEEDLWQLKKRVAELETANRKLELEWTDLYDKVRRQMSRMAKRYAVDKREAETETDISSENSHLDHLDPVSRSIMLRRAHTGVKT